MFRRCTAYYERGARSEERVLLQMRERVLRRYGVDECRLVVPQMKSDGRVTLPSSSQFKFWTKIGGEPKDTVCVEIVP